MLKIQRKRKRGVYLSHLGTLMITISLIGFLFVFYPIIRMYLFPPTVDGKIETTTGFTIKIPRINAQAPIIKNVDPFNESIYKEALKKGVAHASTSSLPGEDGTTFLFAHSSAYPWELTRFNTAFLRLADLRKKDTIEIVYEGEKKIYEVTNMQEVLPNETSFLTKTQKYDLILQTCTPIGTALKRLLVFADEKSY